MQPASIPGKLHALPCSGNCISFPSMSFFLCKTWILSYHVNLNCDLILLHTPMLPEQFKRDSYTQTVQLYISQSDGLLLMGAKGWIKVTHRISNKEKKCWQWRRLKSWSRKHYWLWRMYPGRKDSIPLAQFPWCWYVRRNPYCRNETSCCLSLSAPWPVVGLY